MRSPFARSKSSRPAMMRPPPCSTSRISDNAVTDLPDPDSPTIATVSPRPTVNETPRTAATTRSVLRNSTDRPLTASSGDESEGKGIEEAEWTGKQAHYRRCAAERQSRKYTAKVADYDNVSTITVVPAKAGTQCR
jgi:hypothetical protein